MNGVDRLVQLVSRNAQPSVTKEYLAPGSPYRRMSVQDEASFRPVLNAWRPTAEPGTTLVRWLTTEWCNYSCPYCPQTHARWEPKGDEFTAHAFDNFPLDSWIEAFYRHFRERRLSLVITGGEPMIDRRSMLPLLQALTSMETLECIRIDTNAFWKPAWYSQVDKSKLILMCTFHPSQTSEREFFDKVEDILANGFNIGMINYVMSAANKDKYYERRDKFLTLGIPLHPNPLFGSDGKFAKEDIELFNEELPEVDYLYSYRDEVAERQKMSVPGYFLRAEVHRACLRRLPS